MIIVRSKAMNMKWKDLVIVVLVTVIVIQGICWVDLFARTKIANYDVKLAHYNMKTKYCPYCGELLK